jgi:peptidoglycan/xylan/chitin deacetylase (PgdA/CDA1 family)
LFFARPKFPILMYHYLGDAPAEEDRPYFVTEAAFAEQMRFLHVKGFRTITLDEAVDAVRGRAVLSKRSVAITFDDGHASFAQIAVPILREFGYLATMFVITNKLEQSGYLDAAAIRSLASEGFGFGSHSHTHRILTKLDDSEVKFELTESKARLEAVLGKEVKYFCYRGGHYNDRVKELLREAGYAAAVCSKTDLNSAKSDVLALNRVGIRGTDDIHRFARKLRGDT